jgi:hypothetical protein
VAVRARAYRPISQIIVPSQNQIRGHRRADRPRRRRETPDERKAVIINRLQPRASDEAGAHAVPEHNSLRCR